VVVGHIVANPLRRLGIFLVDPSCVRGLLAFDNDVELVREAFPWADGVGVIGRGFVISHYNNYLVALRNHRTNNLVMHVPVGWRLTIALSLTLP